MQDNNGAVNIPGRPHIALALIAALMGCMGSTTRNRLNQPAKYFYAQRLTSVEDLLWLCNMEEIPCGLEESPEDPISSWGRADDVVRSTQSLTVRQLFDLMLQSHPAYRWEFRNGVVNVVPVKGKEYRKNNIPVLDLAISSLTLRVHRTDSAILAAICAEASVFRSTGATLGSHPRSLLKDGVEPMRHISFRNVRVRDALNEITRQDGKGMWTFGLNRDANDFEALWWPWRSGLKSAPR